MSLIPQPQFNGITNPLTTDLLCAGYEVKDASYVRTNVLECETIEPKVFGTPIEVTTDLDLAGNELQAGNLKLTTLANVTEPYMLCYNTTTKEVSYAPNSGGGGGTIVGIAGGSNITVDNTVPSVPVVNLNADIDVQSATITNTTADPTLTLTDGTKTATIKYEAGFDQVTFSGNNAITINSDNPQYNFYAPTSGQFASLTYDTGMNSIVNHFADLRVENNNATLNIHDSALGASANFRNIGGYMTYDGIPFNMAAPMNYIGSNDVNINIDIGNNVNFNNGHLTINSLPGNTNAPYLTMNDVTHGAGGAIVFDYFYQRWYFANAGLSASFWMSLDGTDPYVQLYDIPNGRAGRMTYEGTNDRIFFNKNIYIGQQGYNLEIDGGGLNPFIRFTNGNSGDFRWDQGFSRFELTAPFVPREYIEVNVPNGMPSQPKLNFYNGNTGIFAQIMLDNNLGGFFNFTHAAHIDDNVVITNATSPYLSLTDGGANTAQMTYDVANNRININKTIQPTSIADVTTSIGTSGQVLASTGANLRWDNPWATAMLSSGMGSQTINNSTYTAIINNSQLWSGSLKPNGVGSYQVALRGALLGGNTKCGMYIQLTNNTQGTTQTCQVYSSGAPYVTSAINFNGMYYTEFNIVDIVVLSSYNPSDVFNYQLYVISDSGTHTFTGGNFSFSLTPIKNSF